MSSNKEHIMEFEINEKKEYQNRKSSDIVNFPVQFRKGHLSLLDNQELVNAPISAVRIIWKILNDLSYDQYIPGMQPAQLSLFENEFKSENNTYARFTFPVSQINKNKDYNKIKKGLEFLSEYKKKWHKFKGKDGKTISTYGGLIYSPTISKNNITFLIPNFFLKDLVEISNYNTALYQIPWVLNKAKQVLFYLWLLELPDKGTKVRFDTLQRTYDYNYKNANVFAKNFLKNIKTILDKKSNLSFNYSIKGEYITIAPYPVKKLDLDLEEKTISNQKITQKLHYWKVRHDLEKKHIDVFKSLINIDPLVFRFFTQSYNEFVKECRKNKTVAGDIKGDVFLSVFQESIKQYYGTTPWAEKAPSGYPKIT